MLHKIFEALVASDFGNELNVSACEEHEHFIVLQFWDGRRHLLSCPFLETVLETPKEN